VRSIGRVRSLLVILLLSTCSEPERAAPVPVTRTELAVSQDGLSGLTVDGDGVLWMVPERARALIAMDGDELRVVPMRDVELADGVDTESITWLGGDRFALGTESDDTSRRGDPILVVERQGEGVVERERIDLPYDRLGVTAEDNHGIEGLCFAAGDEPLGGVLVAALENVVERDGSRLAPLGRYAGGQWTRVEVELTTDTGKISALSCRREGDAIEVLAIERHFAVMQVLRFTLRDDTRRVRPRVVLDLSGSLRDDPNIEGLVEVDGTLRMIVDNHYGRRTGPNELVRAQLP